MPITDRRSRRVRLEDIGARDKPVTIEQGTAGVDTSGFPVVTWSTLTSLAWMSREDVGGMERLTAQQVSAPYETRWVMTYQANMDPEILDVTKLRRLVYRGRTHDITRAEVINDRADIELLTIAKP